MRPNTPEAAFELQVTTHAEPRLRGLCTRSPRRWSTAHSARAYLAVVESAHAATSLAARAEMARFLDAVDRDFFESKADHAERAVLAERMGSEVSDARWLTLSLIIAHELEAATDALAAAALGLRDHVTAGSEWR